MITYHVRVKCVEESAAESAPVYFRTTQVDAVDENWIPDACDTAGHTVRDFTIEREVIT